MKQVKKALRRLRIQGMLTQLGEDQAKMRYMFRIGRGIDENVIQVDHQKTAQKLMENVIDEVLEDCRGICQSKRHHQVFVVPLRGVKGCLPLIPSTDMFKIIRSPKIGF